MNVEILIHQSKQGSSRIRIRPLGSASGNGASVSIQSDAETDEFTLDPHEFAVFENILTGRPGRPQDDAPLDLEVSGSFSISHAFSRAQYSFSGGKVPAENYKTLVGRMLAYLRDVRKESPEMA